MIFLKFSVTVLFIFFQKLYDLLIIEKKKNILSWKNVKHKSQSLGIFQICFTDEQS